MTVRFAGSCSVDERRRRRLAVDLEDSPPREPYRMAVAVSNRRSTSGSTDDGNASPHAVPLRRLISAKIWKLVLIAFVWFLLGAGLLWGRTNQVAIERISGPACGRLLAGSDSPLPSMYGSLSLFFAGQLALLIWWVRSQSRADFSGRFRIWAWGSAFGFLFALTVAGDLHHVWSATILWFCKIEFWQKETLCWLAPAVGSATALLWEIKSDMRGCRISRGLLGLAIISWSISAAFTLGLGDAEQLGIDPALAILGAAMLGHFLIFASLLFHARYVAYVSAESPPRLPRLRWTAIIGSAIVFLWRTITVRRRVVDTVADTDTDADCVAGSETVAVTDSETDTDAGDADQQSACPVKSATQATPCRSPTGMKMKGTGSNGTAAKKKRGRKSVPKKHAPSANSVKNDEQGPSVQPQPTAPAGVKSTGVKSTGVKSTGVKSTDETDADPATASVNLRLDDAIDPSHLKGLSKRERRKLRKEHRESRRRTGIPQ